MDRLAELLASITDLAAMSEADLRGLRSDLEDAMRQAREGELTSDVSAAMRTAAEQYKAIKVELGERDAQAQQIIAEADAALAMLDDPTDETDGDDDEVVADDPTDETDEGEAGTETAEDDATPDEETTAGDADDAPTEAIAAAASPARSQARRPVKIPARHKPRASTGRRPLLIASGEVHGVAAGSEFANFDEIDKAVWDKWVALRSSPDGIPHHMATIDYREMFPPERRLAGFDPMELGDKVRRVLNNEREALVASGGVPGPAEPRYEQITFGQANRPLRDALPSFLASRGEIVFNGSPLLGDVVLDTGAGAIGEVTSAQDVSGVTKNIQEMSAPTPTTVVVAAETMRWKQGNWADRFLPERTRAFLALGQVAFARHNDALRLLDIKTGSTKWTDTPAKFGAYRDLKREFYGVFEELEDRIRDDNQQFRVLMPGYVPAMLATDLIAQQPGDQAWKITDAAVRADMQSWLPNVNITFLHDSIRGRMLTTPSGQSPRTPGFDADVEWAAFPEGGWLFLTGGTLDLGILRDTATSALNQFQTFYEEWEAVARLIDQTLSVWITSSLCANGSSQLASAINVCSPQNS